MNQEPIIQAALLENAIEAGALEMILKQRNIPHAIRSYQDSAYNGLFQLQKGWGCVEAPASYRDEIVDILDDLRSGGLSLENGPSEN